jgi:hypothetical protein
MISSPSAAAAQVAGLACYLWHLDGTLSVDELLLRLQHAASASGTPGILDASIAALSVERAGSDVRLRALMLDVWGPGENADGAFTEHDIERFLEAFDTFEGAIEPDWSVYDLNGDGWTGGSGGARMDLDANDLPGFTTVEQSIDGESVSYDETSITDQEMLCYFAWSPFYTGDPTTRTELLGGPCGAGDLVLPGSWVGASFDLDLEGYESGDYDSADGDDLALVTDFGDHAAAFDSTLTLDGIRTTVSTHTTAGLHRESGGTVTIALDHLTTASVAWPHEEDDASAEGGGEFHVGLEIFGEHTVSISGRLRIEAFGEDADAFAYVRVGPDSTISGWSFPEGGSWRLNGWEIEEGILDIETAPATIPDGTHRLWLNLQAGASADSNDDQGANGSNAGTAALEDVLVVITPTEAGRSGVRILAR